MRSSRHRGDRDPGPGTRDPNFRRVSGERHSAGFGSAVAIAAMGRSYKGFQEISRMPCGSGPWPRWPRPGRYIFISATDIPKARHHHPRAPPQKKPTAPWTRRGRSVLQMKESACKPGSVRPKARQSFLWARRHRRAQATYPGATRATPMLPYSVLLRVGFTVPRGVVPARGALLPHPFTLATHIRRCRSAVCSLLHWPSVHTAQALPGTLPCGARTFLDMQSTPRLSGRLRGLL